MIDLMCSFLVVNNGNFSRKSNRVCAPKIDNVPVPVRSLRGRPRSRTSRRRSWYWRTLEIIAAMPFAKTKKVLLIGGAHCHAVVQGRGETRRHEMGLRRRLKVCAPLRRLFHQPLYKALRSAAPTHPTKNCAPSPVSSVSSKRCDRDKFPVRA
jgi:hypothetical protein